MHLLFGQIFNFILSKYLTTATSIIFSVKRYFLCDNFTPYLLKQTSTFWTGTLKSFHNK